MIGGQRRYEYDKLSLSRFSWFKSSLIFNNRSAIEKRLSDPISRGHFIIVYQPWCINESESTCINYSHAWNSQMLFIYQVFRCLKFQYLNNNRARRLLWCSQNMSKTMSSCARVSYGNTTVTLSGERYVRLVYLRLTFWISVNGFSLWSFVQIVWRKFILNRRNGKSLCEIEEKIHWKWHWCHLQWAIVVREFSFAEKRNGDVIETTTKSYPRLQEGKCNMHSFVEAQCWSLSVFHLQEHFMPAQSKLTKKRVPNEDSSNDLNLTGSPLRDTCDIDYINDSVDSFLGWNNLWTEEDESFRPISIVRAQYVWIADSHIEMILMLMTTFLQTNSEWNMSRPRGTWQDGILGTWRSQRRKHSVDIRRIDQRLE